MEPNKPVLRAGDEVEVRQRYTAGWARGFRVDDVTDGDAAPQVWLRRQSDGARLPRGFPIQDVRPA